MRTVEEMPIYEGPVLELSNIETYYSDSAVVRLKLNAPKQYEYENKDKEFPDGIYLEFYEKDGSVTTTLEANYCYNYAQENKWRALRDVVIINRVNNEKIFTEELFWLQDKEIIYTNKFVRIETEDQILMGEGMEASQDISWWRILEAKGTISLENDQEEKQ